MNKVLNINLGGYPFTIDDDAFHHLKQYLGAIDSHFKHSEGFEDITTDIEARIAEIFAERVKGRQIVTIKDVSEAINVMGTPEDFGAESNYTGVPPKESETDRNETNSTNKVPSKRQRFGKRVYRNTENSAVGGVASGVSAYFGIDEPLWVRLAFVLFIIGGGFGIPLYFILWAVLPEAKTAKQKLEMRGEKIDVKNIAKTIEEEMKHVSERISEIGGGFTGKKKNKKKSKQKPSDDDDESEKLKFGSSGSAAFGKGIGFVRQASRALERTVRAIIKPLFFIIGIVLMVIVAILWVGWIVFASLGHEYLNFLVTTYSINLVKSIAFLMVGLPLIGVALFVIRVFFKVKIHKAWRWGFAGSMILVVTCFFYHASHTGSDFDQEVSVTETMDLSDFDQDILKVDVVPFRESSSKFAFSHTRIEEGELLYKCLSFRIEQAEGSQFEVTYDKSARGESTRKATKRTKVIKFEPELTKGELKFKSFLKLAKNEKWRNQRVKVTLKVPVGKSIKVTENLAHSIHFDAKAVDGYYHSWQLANKTLKMEAQGLVCVDCEEEPVGKDENQLSYKNFTHLDFSGDIKVYLNQGDEYKITTSVDHGPASDIFSEQEDSVLRISSHSSHDVKVFITMPALLELTSNDKVEAWIKGFDNGYMKMNISGESEMHMQDLKLNQLEIEARDKADITLKGEAHHFVGRFSNDSELDADRFQVRVADIKGNDDSDIKLSVSDTLRKKMSKEADLKIEGEPVIVQE